MPAPRLKGAQNAQSNGKSCLRPRMVIDGAGEKGFNGFMKKREA